MLQELVNHRSFLFLITLAAGVAVLAGFVTVLWRLSQPVPKVEDLATVSLSEVVAAVKRELQAAQPYLSSEDLPLKTVELELQVVVLEETSGSGKAMLLPLGAASALSATKSTTQTQTVKVVLAPPSPGITKGPIDLSHLGLASAIRAVRDDLEKGMSEPPPLEPKEIEIALTFGVERTSTVESGVELKAFEGKVAAKLDVKSTQKILLTFARPKAAEAAKGPAAWD